MRPGAKIDEFAILKKRDLFAFGNVINALQFVGLVDGLIIFLSFVARFFRKIKGLIFLHHLLHLSLYLLEIFRTKAVFQVEIVVEAFLGRWANI